MSVENLAARRRRITKLVEGVNAQKAFHRMLDAQMSVFVNGMDREDPKAVTEVLDQHSSTYAVNVVIAGIQSQRNNLHSSS